MGSQRVRMITDIVSTLSREELEQVLHDVEITLLEMDISEGRLNDSISDVNFDDDGF